MSVHLQLVDDYFLLDPFLYAPCKLVKAVYTLRRTSPGGNDPKMNLMNIRRGGNSIG